jgi:LAO/AO transport system ATPase
VAEGLAERYRRGDRLALSRLLSLAARGEDVVDALRSPRAARPPACVVAVTGSAGVGKSTLVGKLIEIIRQQGQSVAVLACDPESPLSGGSLLGDRFRMPTRPDDDGVFIRSLATPGGHGAIAPYLESMIALLEGFGFDIVILETVGAGQGDTVVRDLADVVVLLLQPETGDDLQWEKAGVLEVADVIVIHKADLPGAERAETQVRAALSLADERPVTVLRVSAKTGEGLDALRDAVMRAAQHRHSHGTDAHALLRLAQDSLASRFDAAQISGDPDVRGLIDRWQRRELTPIEAATTLLTLLGSWAKRNP